MKPATQTGLQGREILLGVTGSIAAYKACELVRRFREKGAEVSCVLTEAAARFVTPLTFAALSGRPVAMDVLDPAAWTMAHLELSKKADAVVVAPSTAETIARLAQGRANDLLSALVLATRAPVFLAPAMHEPMWTHKATRQNVKTCRSYGYRFIGPVVGAFAANASGLGRMEDPSRIVEQVAAALKHR